MLLAARFSGRALSRDDSSAIQISSLLGSGPHAFSSFAAPSSGPGASDAWLSARLAATASSAEAVRPTQPEPLGNGSGDASTTQARTGDQRIDALLSGNKWSDGSITYSDTDSAADYQAGYNSDGDGDGISAQNEGFSQFSAQQMISFHAALNDAVYTQLAGAVGFSVEGFTNLNITYNGAGSGTATIRGANSSDPGTSYAYYPSGNIYGGDTFIGPSARTPTAGNYAWYTMFHELGHSLGLKHGQETNVYGALPADVNSNEFSIMTYMSYIGDPGGPVNWETWGAPQTFMMLDIAALQAMYGADYSVNSGNTVYSWNPTSGETYVNGVLAIDPGGNRIFMTVWDGGGIDTYDLSNYTSNLEINLNEGSYSDFNSGQSSYLGGGPNGGYARGNVFNALLYQGNTASLIENATGGTGSDTIVGNQASNVLRGNGGNDALYGYGGADTLYGGDGNDVLVMGGGGNDRAYGEGGDDTVYWGPPSPSTSDVRYMDGGTGIDTINGGGTAFGGTTFNLGAGIYTNNGGFTESWVNFENYYNNGIGSEVVIGSSSNNRIQTGSGNNTLDGGDGEDILYGGAGNDVIYGGFFTDTVYGEAGNDTFIVRGTASSTEFGDNTDGGADVDTLDLSQIQQYAVIMDLAAGTWRYDPAYGPVWSIVNVENIIGTQRGDTITGNSGTNVIRGGLGDDVINGGGGAGDQLYGDDGNDRIIWMPAPSTARTVDGGTGTDTIDGGGASFVSGVTFNLGAGTYTYTGSGFTEAWTNFENYTNNGNGVETVIGTAGANIITTGSGNNALSGGDGNDTLNGGLGDDTMDGGNGTDIADYSTATAGVTVNAGTTTAQNTGGAGTDILIGIEGLIGSAFDDVLTGTGLTGGYVRAGDGNDYVYAALGADNLDGGNGIDTVDGSLYTGDYVINLATGLTNFLFESMINFENAVSGAGNDTLIGTAGANTLDGGSGNDTLNGGLGNDRLIGGLGVDVADYSDAAAAVRVNLSLTTAQNTGGAGNDRLIEIEGINGSAFNDRLTGGTTNDTLRGNDGNDILAGGDGADILLGGDGIDQLTGGASNDRLTGGLGKDTLSGNGGRDVFVYTALADSTGTDIDTINDFQTTIDRIDLSAISTEIGGSLAFIGSAAFTGAGNEVRYRISGGDTRVMIDVDGDKVADFTIRATGSIDFVLGDFVLA